MKVLVTGANGYLGQGIVKALLNLGHQVVAADLDTTTVDDRALKKACDLFSIPNPMEYFDRPDVLLHLAWRNGFIHNAETHLDDLPSHYHFIKTMAESGIQRLAVMGTMHEVGFYEGCVTADTPCNPMNLYGISKNALRSTAEWIARQQGIPLQWLRGFYIVSNSKRSGSIFSKIAEADANHQMEFPFTSGQNAYDFLDYDVFCQYVAAAVGQDRVTGIINIASGEPVKLADRVERFIRDNHFQIQLKYGAFPDRAYDSAAIWGDSAKIRSILDHSA